MTISDEDPISQVSPLAGNPARSASDALGGYDYQLWQSVLAWLELAESDLLYLEGAEDIDLVTRDGATTTQVKRTAEKISLNTQRAVEAIENFLIAFEANQHRRVKYRYLTTSVPAIEHGEPFGPGVAGIRVWEEYRTSTFPPIPDLARAEVIAGILRAKASDHPKLLNLLSGTSTTSTLILFRDVIRRFQWATGEHGTDRVRERVYDILRSRSERLRFPPSDARRIASVLYERAVRTAINRPSTPLTRGSLNAEIEAATHVSVARSHLDALLAAGAGAHAGGRLEEGKWDPSNLDLCVLDGDERFCALCFELAKAEWPHPLPSVTALWDGDRHVLSLGDVLVLTKFVEGDLEVVKPAIVKYVRTIERTWPRRLLLCLSVEVPAAFRDWLRETLAQFPSVASWDLWTLPELTERLRTRPDLLDFFFYPVVEAFRRSFVNEEMELVRFELVGDGSWFTDNSNTLAFSKREVGGDLVLDVIVRNRSMAESLVTELVTELTDVERTLHGVPGEGLLFPQITYRASLHGGDNGCWRQRLEPPLIVRPGGHERFRIALTDSGYAWSGTLSLSVVHGRGRTLRFPRCRLST